MSKSGPTEEPLVAAARALEGELTRYAAIADEVRSVVINSEKTLARASRSVQEAASCHERILANVAALSTAMTETRQRQERTLEQMAEAAQKVSDRATAFRALLGRYEALAAQSRSLNTLAARTAALRAEGKSTELAAAVAELLHGTGEIVAEAASLSAAATNDDFEDLARTVDALKQQMQSARNKLSLAHKTIGDSRPS